MLSSLWESWQSRLKRAPFKAAVPFAASFRDKEEMTRFLEEFLKPGDCVLFKGSNSMKLGETALYFRNKGKEQAESAQARG